MKNAAARSSYARTIAADARSAFEKRYHAVLEAVATFVHARRLRNVRFVTAQECAEWVAGDLPSLYRATFGSRKEVKRLKAWRVKTMLANASFLGAFAEYDLRAVRGKGLATTRAPLRVVRGGKK